jgi:hypothetical protein
MAIFLETNTNGFNKEGIGSVVQWNLLLFCMAKDLGVEISVLPFKNIAHYNYTNYTSKEWSESFTNFFKFPYTSEFDVELEFDGEYKDLEDFIDENLHTEKNISISIPKKFIVEHGQKNISKYFQKKYLTEIKQNIAVDKNYFQKNHLNICLHIRSNNPNDVDFDICREAFLRHIDDSKFKNIITELKDKHQDNKVCLHIHSQGDIENFNNILNLSTKNFKIKCHLNEHPTVDIYHMSNADFLIMANSSYSWICHLLNYNPTYVRDNFWHSVYPNAIFLNSDYKIKL